MDKSRGYVRNWRAIDEWQWYTVPHHAHVFQHLIRKVNRKSKFWQGIEIKRGQTLMAQRVLAVECGVSHKTIRTILRNLSLTGEIELKRAHGGAHAGTILTICNYDLYQAGADDEGTLDGTPEAHVGHTRGTRGAHNENPEKPNNQEKKSRRFTPPSPQEVSAYGQEINYKIDGQSFVDFYAAKGWVVGKSPMKDWKAAVRTWKQRDTIKAAPPARREVVHKCYFCGRQKAESQMKRHPQFCSEWICREECRA